MSGGDWPGREAAAIVRLLHILHAARLWCNKHQVASLVARAGRRLKSSHKNKHNNKHNNNKISGDWRSVPDLKIAP